MSASHRARCILSPKTALLGGTTSLGDCVAGASLLVRPASLVDGEALGAYEDEFARRAGVPYGAAFAAGRVGLYGILRCLGIGAGDEVLVPVPTHVVVANAVRYTGARPVYVDCQPETYTIDLDQAARRVTPRTRVLILQHTFGIPAHLDDATELCRHHELELIEDCVHSLGATFRGRPLGSFGHAAFFSTEETKTISTTMGGVATTSDPELAARLMDFRTACAAPPAWLTARYVTKLIVYHALTEPHLHRSTRALYELLGRHQPLGGPTTAQEARCMRPEHYTRRLSNAQAALGLRQLRRLDANLRHRRAVCEVYEERLRHVGVRLPAPPPGAQPAYSRYPVFVPDRLAAVRALQAHTVPGLWFTSVLEEAIAPIFGGYRTGDCPRAEACASHLVNLPTHPRVSLRQASVIADALAEGVPGTARRPAPPRTIANATYTRPT